MSIKVLGKSGDKLMVGGGNAAVEAAIAEAG